MFENLLSLVINRALSDYLANVNVDQLKVDLFKGDAELKDLHLREDAFEQLGLPLRIKHSHIGRVVLHVPVKRPLVEPWFARVDDVYVLIVPAVRFEYDEKAESELRRRRRRAELERFETMLAEQANRMAVESGARKWTENEQFFEDLALALLRNLHAEVHNVHVRYEDAVVDPERPLALGVTFSSAVYTTNSEEQNDSDEEEAAAPASGRSKERVGSKMRKTFRLSGLRVYLHVHASALSAVSRSEDVFAALAAGVEDGEPSAAPRGNESVVGPLTVTAELRLDLHPERHAFNAPRCDVRVRVGTVAMRFTRRQLVGVALNVAEVNRLLLETQYAKHGRPARFTRTEAANWWRFAYRVTLHERVRKRVHLSWTAIRAHLTKCHEYRHLFGLRLARGKSLREDERRRLEQLELDELDVFNIMLRRQQAALQLAGGKRRKSNWFAALFAAAAPSSDSASLSDAAGTPTDPKEQWQRNAAGTIGRIADELSTPAARDEMRALYALIYEHEFAAARIPADYFGLRFVLRASRLHVTLVDDVRSEPVAVCTLRLSGAHADFRYRSETDAIRLRARLRDVEIRGLPRERQRHSPAASRSDLVTPIIVTSRPLAPDALPIANAPDADSDGEIDETKDSAPPFIDLEFTTNAPCTVGREDAQPVPVQAAHEVEDHVDFTLRVTTQSAVLVYDTPTVNALCALVRAPRALYVADLSDVLAEARERGETTMRRLLRRQLTGDVRITLQPSRLILPNEGTYADERAALIVSFGSWHLLRTPLASSDAHVRSAWRNARIKRELLVPSPTFQRSELNSALYDSYTLTVSAFRVYVVDRAADWSRVELASSPSRRHHLVAPLDLTVTLQRCIALDDDRFPANRVSGRIGTLRVTLSNLLIRRSLSVLLSLGLFDTIARLRADEAVTRRLLELDSLDPLPDADRTRELNDEDGRELFEWYRLENPAGSGADAINALPPDDVYAEPEQQQQQQQQLDLSHTLDVGPSSGGVVGDGNDASDMADEDLDTLSLTSMCLPVNSRRAGGRGSARGADAVALEERRRLAKFVFLDASFDIENITVEVYESIKTDAGGQEKQEGGEDTPFLELVLDRIAFRLRTNYFPSVLRMSMRIRDLHLDDVRASSAKCLSRIISVRTARGRADAFALSFGLIQTRASTSVGASLSGVCGSLSVPLIMKLSGSLSSGINEFSATLVAINLGKLGSVDSASNESSDSGLGLHHSASSLTQFVTDTIAQPRVTSLQRPALTVLWRAVACELSLVGESQNALTNDSLWVHFGSRGSVTTQRDGATQFDGELDLWRMLVRPYFAASRNSSNQAKVLYAPTRILLAGAWRGNARDAVAARLSCTAFSWCISPALVRICARTVAQLAQMEDVSGKAPPSDACWTPRVPPSAAAWYLQTTSSQVAQPLVVPTASNTDCIAFLLSVNLPKLELCFEPRNVSDYESQPLIRVRTAVSSGCLSVSHTGAVSVDVRAALVISYYNEARAGWEPLLEKVETYVPAGADSDIDSLFQPPAFHLRVHTNFLQPESIAEAAAADAARASVKLSAKMPFNWTLTRCALDVLTRLGTIYSEVDKNTDTLKPSNSDAADDEPPRRNDSPGTVRIRNETGVPLRIVVEERSWLKRPPNSDTAKSSRERSPSRTQRHRRSLSHTRSDQFMAPSSERDHFDELIQPGAELVFEDVNYAIAVERLRSGADRDDDELDEQSSQQRSSTQSLWRKHKTSSAVMLSRYASERSLSLFRTEDRSSFWLSAQLDSSLTQSIGVVLGESGTRLFRLATLDIPTSLQPAKSAVPQRTAPKLEDKRVHSDRVMVKRSSSASRKGRSGEKSSRSVNSAGAALALTGSNSDKQKQNMTVDSATVGYVSMRLERQLHARTITFQSRVCITNHFPLRVVILCAGAVEPTAVAKNAFFPVELFTIEANANCHLPLAFAEACVAGNATLLVRPISTTKDISYAVSKRGLAVGREDQAVLLCAAQQDKAACCILATRVGNNDEPRRRGVMARILGKRGGEQKRSSTREVGTGEYMNYVLSPNIMIHNQLPMLMDCIVEGCDEQVTIEPGDKCALLSAVVGQSLLRFHIAGYLQADWDATWPLRQDQHGIFTLDFVTRTGYHQTTQTLSFFLQYTDGVLHATVFAAYWLVNKTGLKLAYLLLDKSRKRAKITSNAQELVMCSVNVSAAERRKTEQAAMGSNVGSVGLTAQSATRASVQVNEGDASDAFALDGAGTAQRLTCVSNKQRFEVSVHIKFCSFRLTKIITFEPYFVVTNQTSLRLEFRERDGDAGMNRSVSTEWFVVEPDSALGYWPKRTGKNMLLELRSRLAATGSAANSSSENERFDPPVFAVSEPHTSIVRLSNADAVRVDVRCNDEHTCVLLEGYQRGMCPALLVNDLSVPALYREQSSPPKPFKSLPPGHRVLFTWEPYAYQVADPAHMRTLELQVAGQTQVFSSEMTNKDAHSGQFGDAAGRHWISFVDDLERVLLLTDSRQVLSAIEQTSYERADLKCELKLASVSLSLVDETYPREVAFVLLTGGGPLWQVKDPNEPERHYQPLQGSWLSTLETAYTRFMDARSSIPETVIVKDERSRQSYEFEIVPPGIVFMRKPIFAYVRRSAESGLWLTYRSSAHRRDVHLKVHHVQVDNQLHACNYPVAFAPIRTRSVAQNVEKPLIELMVLCESRLQWTVLHVKYCKLLVQEAFVKLDRNLLLALINLFNRPPRERDALVRLRSDINTTTLSLYEHYVAEVGGAAERRLYFEYLHVSPLKLTLTFSTLIDKSDYDSPQRAKDRANEEWFNALLPGFGAVGEVADGVVIKLGYFERRCELQTMSRIAAEVGAYYAKQLFKQIYVFVFGLPILGNPYGVLRGFASGVQNFFYEPLEGAVLGPQELAQGMASGTKALVGGTVGGVAGALSKMTGAIGSGIAKVSFDDEDLRRRRISKAKAHQTQAPTSYMQAGGRQVVEGVISALTGVVTKPVMGAKRDGVAGAMKGLARGAFGLITQPVVGFTSLISDTLQAVKTVTDTAQVVQRSRLPRYLAVNCLVRAYSFVEAEALVLLQEANDGKYLATDTYLAHCTAGAGNKQVLVVTDCRILLLEPTMLNMIRKWVVRMVVYDDLETPPRYVHNEGIVFVYKMESKQRLLDKKQNADLVEIRDSTAAERMCEIIAAALEASALSVE